MGEPSKYLTRCASLCRRPNPPCPPSLDELSLLARFTQGRGEVISPPDFGAAGREKHTGTTDRRQLSGRQADPRFGRGQGAGGWVEGKPAHWVNYASRVRGWQINIRAFQSGRLGCRRSSQLIASRLSGDLRRRYCHHSAPGKSYPSCSRSRFVVDAA